MVFRIPDLKRTCHQDTPVSELYVSHQGSREQGSKTSNRNDIFSNPWGKKKRRLDNKHKLKKISIRTNHSSYLTSHCRELKENQAY